jgi:hypothetical protein
VTAPLAVTAEPPITDASNDSVTLLVDEALSCLTCELVSDTVSWGEVPSATGTTSLRIVTTRMRFCGLGTRLCLPLGFWAGMISCDDAD